MTERRRSDASAPSGSFWRTIRMVGWSFFGVRKKSESEEDMNRVNPLHVIAGGIAGAVIFVLGLIVLVNWVTAP